ncbi:hypothetical protein [Hydrogenimonas cancrithermarum]|uniref:Uncharacterized protein n=1 Tax=Hydrogenimonas cancrithermarum TaxID=2993563 RepID=A0ABN6WXU6_9BACT|nr:hypothetical protein [Hydrogenimonas cancrithermarum]BDY14013.1 hypothetical protein HCR_23260 [Hydrogenimonas cancrithermarum]
MSGGDIAVASLVTFVFIFGGVMISNFIKSAESGVKLLGTLGNYHVLDDGHKIYLSLDKFNTMNAMPISNINFNASAAGSMSMSSSGLANNLVDGFTQALGSLNILFIGENGNTISVNVPNNAQKAALIQYIQQKLFQRNMM